jgi:hypothetical protein
MIRMLITLSLVLTAPFCLIGIGLHSWPVAVAGVAVSMLYLILFLSSGFSEFISDLRATHVEESLEERLQRLWNQAGPPRLGARFWVYPSPLVEFKIWVQDDSRVEILFSRGLIQLATDSGLKAAFQSIGVKRIAEVRLQNRLHAFMTRLERLKGPKEDFRYWFLSFWLYPLERLLNIAKI